MDILGYNRSYGVFSHREQCSKSMCYFLHYTACVYCVVLYVHCMYCVVLYVCIVLCGMCVSCCATCVKVTQDKVKTCLEQQDYSVALRELVLPSDREKAPGSWETLERDIGSEALRVAALHDHFGHKLASMLAIHQPPYTCTHIHNVLYCVIVD